jgi:YtkA-like protein
MRKILFAISVVGFSIAASGQQQSVTVALTTKPAPLGLGQNLFEAVVKDAKGQPVTDADVALMLVMPADPKTKHPEMRTEGKLNNVGAGKYNGIAMVTMAGDWNVTVTATRHGKPIGQTKQKLTAYVKTPTTKK